MKRILIISGLALALSTAVVTQSAYAGKVTSISATNTKVLSAFNLYFPNAGDVTWFAKDNSFTAYFKIQEGKGTAAFDKHGHLLHTVLYHYDTDLPVNISMKLKDEYQGYNVQNVVEYTDSDRHFYFIMLENKTQLVRVRIGDTDQPVVIEKLRKA